MATKIEILLSLITHKDIYLSLVMETDKYSTVSANARPRFIYYEKVTNELLRVLNENKFEIEYQSQREYRIPFGVKFENDVETQILEDHLYVHKQNIFKKKDKKYLYIDAIYFPNISMAYFLWNDAISKNTIDINKNNHKHSDTTTNPVETKKILYLISSKCQPVNENIQNIEVSSTTISSNIISRFLNHVFPDINIYQLTTDGDSLHYQANRRFLYDVIYPSLEKMCLSLSSVHGEKWWDYFHLTLLLSGGTPAQLTIYHNGLLIYRPDSILITQLDYFWYKRYINVDLVSIEYYHLIPCPLIEYSQLKLEGQLIVEELKKYRDEILSVLKNPSDTNELKSFWIRKSQKMVISALMTRTNDEFQFYRGINLEVSMPTGSLCSERNAIGSALATNINLRRVDLVGVAILFIDLKETDIPRLSNPFSTGNPCKPCGVCKEWLHKICEVNPIFKIYTFTDIECNQVYVDSLI